jgi:hypothetical protein
MKQVRTCPKKDQVKSIEQNHNPTKRRQGKQKVHTSGQQESKFHIKTEMSQTILEIFMSIQYVKHNHHAKNWKQRSSFDKAMKMNKINIKLCDIHCHTILTHA